MKQITVRAFIQQYPTVAEAAKALGVSRQSLYTWGKAGPIPSPWDSKARELLSEKPPVKAPMF